MCRVVLPNGRVITCNKGVRNGVKYALKCARGLYRIRRLTPANAPEWRGWWGDWEILKRGTYIPRDTVKPLTTFADIYRANHNI